MIGMIQLQLMALVQLNWVLKQDVIGAGVIPYTNQG